MDVAEIPGMQEIATIDLNKDGMLDDNEEKSYRDGKIRQLLSNIHPMLDGQPISFALVHTSLSFPEGQGGLKTVRLASVFENEVEFSGNVHTFSFRDENFVSGRGWKEIVVMSMGGATIHESSAPDKDITNELRSYPADMLSTPLNLNKVTVSFIAGTTASQSAFLSFNDRLVQKASDGFAELISARELSPTVIIISLLIALVLGAGHALTPGHGKTIVAAYLVGSRGTAKHAAFLGFTVTATHTIGVFAMGLIALFASQYILPETLFPWLSLMSGLIVVGIGVSLFMKRLQLATRPTVHPNDGHTHTEHEHNGHEHTHDGTTHSHLPPGADGTPVTWKSLFALGVSGGLLPCPSAIVVLLSAIALGRIGFGLLLIASFSLGLAGVLTGIGLLMVYARRYFERFNTSGPLLRWLPVVSSLVVSIAGAVISLQAFGQTGIQFPQFDTVNASTPGGISLLVLGFVLGLKHALDADHLIAVSTIVSERKGVLSSSIVGALWGLGHTASLLIVSVLVIALQIQIPDRIALGMEFAVALMLVALGVNVLFKVFRGGQFHTHVHTHLDFMHAHPHVHSHEHVSSHHKQPFSLLPHSAMTFLGKGKKSVMIGMVHGLAGSAALMLIVLATIPSPGLALAYVGIFGLGSVGGMMAMSALIGIPFVLTANRSETLNFIVRGASGFLSIGFGIFYAWQIAAVDRLFF
jgi:ABC-type nickel/cobalt efflux system permease component RcnA